MNKYLLFMTLSIIKVPVIILFTFRTQKYTHLLFSRLPEAHG